jgi:hypothetical protein
VNKFTLGTLLQLGATLVALALAYGNLKMADAELRVTLSALKESQQVQSSFTRSWEEELSSRIRALEQK